MVWFESLQHFISEADQVLIVSHVNPDGDAVSSTLAAGYLLKRWGKQVTMVNESPVPKKFFILEGTKEIVSTDQISGRFRHVIALDCADRERMGNIRQLLAEDAFIINIDHHATNERFGDVNIVVPDAAATVEILFDWVEQAGVSLDQRLASYLYTGLLTDTGGFRYSNTTPKVLRIAAQLVDTGIESHKIADAVLETVTIEQLQLLQKALSSLRRSDDGLVAWMSLSRKDTDAFLQSHEDLDGIVNYARNILGVDVGILFRETEDGTVKVSLRSREFVDVGKVAKAFGGGGHARAAGCTFHGSLKEAEEKMLPRLRLELECEKR
ncbi:MULTISPECIES: bifunctional oligoribonuclease/PAP phosphatase NrnA [Thermoactinomyces]|jgi:bifunctional oligoribonuclease and PAP phosphatase NrnA|uniref:Bifunctional oligoribonuclease/PAP phosphatase NrnA n=1 Tax=Thermoactinomyces daqus TaxID=1329516 RepID=A0A7W1X976_9BACL|nr:MULTISPECIES: bifunctional oligoribonuclease/PAP phosphatase NrnA [Thermoactinomyces]MBA4542304.1 bifunctional oligoribonuclease/PAP phosphatase NrnA [Thermoactinomyces daqus]MBH8598245.1 bifunctional oligoribonuclease/PAP phosphatase NrnA [Thermoactinomyces sp. CICC 10523]MBH8604368.1 bifunctional oligoribonuclease/PAP phosphatase NrnA [Thermoactinomyces sp. CICC 10522]MBH8608517.1 bifunctional oligoribonuclease/PAP phosphatase NrnA [Thermoactinomyces sp. CICC 10521]